MSNREPLLPSQQAETEHQLLRDEASLLDIKALMAAARRQWAWLLIPPVLFGTLGWFRANLQEDVYEATASVLLQPTAAQSRLGTGERSTSDADRDISTEEQLLNGPAMETFVELELGRGVSFKADAVSDTDILEITAEDNTPALAAATADAIAAIYIGQRRERIRTDLASAIDDLDTQIELLEAELDSLSTSTRRTTAIESEILGAEAQIQRLASEAALTNGEVRVAAAAIPPNKRISPNPVRSAIGWTVLGMLVGFGLGWVRERLDRRIRSVEDLIDLSSDLEFVDDLPKPDLSALTGPAALLVDDVADRFRVLATNIGSNAKREPCVIQVSGVEGSEGTTFVATNLAATFAVGGWSTVLVDADLSDGDLHQIFGIPIRPGVKQLLDGDQLAAVVQTAPQIEGLWIIANGARPGSDASLHSSELNVVLERLSSHFDVVIVDSPAILSSGDASVLASHADKTVLVAALNKTDRPSLDEALHAVGAAGGHPVAIVLAAPTRTVIRRSELRSVSSSETAVTTNTASIARATSQGHGAAGQ